jgi:lipopolysaccharide export system permease protein
MIGRTLGFYFARRFLLAVLGVFMGVFFLVFLIDFVEMTRKMSDHPHVGTGSVFQITLFRVPQITELVLPFAVLIGAMTTFVALSRKLELVVARAAGISAWQFVMPTLVSALILGVLAALAYNPLAADLRERSTRLESDLTVQRGSSLQQATDSGLWVRQRSDDAQSIVNAQSSSEQGLALTGVTIFVFDLAGAFQARIEAASARLDSGFWLLTDGRRYVPGAEPETFATARLPTNLTREQVRDSFVAPETVSFWALPEFIELAKRAGISSLRYEVQYQLLIARPFLLVAMVLIAAAVSLRFFRMGGVGKMLLGGVAAGFLLYVAGELTEDLGRAGLVSPLLAAWSPPLVAALIGVMALLYQEDG